MKLKARPQDYVYDCECYPNFFSAIIKHPFSGKRWQFEISEWRNDGLAFYQFLILHQSMGSYFVGYNNHKYDYMLLDVIMRMLGRVDHHVLWNKNQAFFAYKGDGLNPHIVWKQKVKQLDLMMIHHFDRKGGFIGLKMLEFNFQSKNIKDLPIPVGTILTREQADEVLTYNDHDVDETIKLYMYSLDRINMREELSQKYQRDFMNHNDTKIGKDYFEVEINKAGIATKHNGNKIQTPRDYVRTGDVLLPYIYFDHPELQRVHKFFKDAVIDEKDEFGMLKLKGFFKNVKCEIDGLEFGFGAGGIHASRKKEIVRSSDTHVLLDWDVASYYPNLAIANKFYPEHLTKNFCKVYIDVYNQRKQYDKKTVENAVLKLALNGVYGDSNNRHSIFLDPKFTCSITVNGQLLLCMLAEQLMKIPDLRMIQLNTDGLTFLCPREHREHANKLWKWWEQLTQLELEEAEYDAMFIRDVNNYMAKASAGYVKRIGCYAYETAIENPATRELVFKKDWGKRVVAKAAEAALVHGKSIEHFIRNHDDKMDFMLRTKVPRAASLQLETIQSLSGTEVGRSTQVLQNISRYYVSKNGGSLIKVMSPTPAQIKRWKNEEHYYHEDHNKHVVVTRGKKPPSGKFKLGVAPSELPPDRRIGIESGLLVKDCSDMNDFDGDIDYDYYINETRKIVEPLLTGTQS